MKEWITSSTVFLNSYIDSFKGLTKEQHHNFDIKKEHSMRVADITVLLADALKLGDEERGIAFLSGIFHDIGRFTQLVKFNTFNDSKSVDHAEQSVKVLEENDIIQKLGCAEEELIFKAIHLHNKLVLPGKLTKREMLLARLLRDADKLDILKVLTDYYTNRNSTPNHTLTWELPKGTSVSAQVAKEILAGKLVSKKEVVSEMDVKIMQLSWVFDINFKPTFEYLMEKRYLEKIYSTLPKNDLIIEIYRKVKVFVENKLLD